MENIKSVFIVEDHPMLREGIKYTIAEHEQFVVIGESSSGKDIFVHLQENEADIIILDISLEDVDGLSVGATIKERYPNVKILVYTMHDKKEYIIEAFKAGVDGYIVKDSAPSVLIKGMSKICKGEYFIDSELAPEIVHAIKTIPNTTELSIDPRYKQLTERERDVLQWVAEGYKSREIAERLFISVKTVETHRSNILKKLNLSNVYEVHRFAEKIGLVKKS